VGVIAMKVFGHGSLKERSLCLRYALNLPAVSLAIIGMDDEKQIDENVQLAQNIKPLSEQEMGRLIQEAKALIMENIQPSDKNPIFWIFDNKTMAWQEDSEPAMVAY
jgi:predicted aldo/keto reductase-like oxidoreductase